MNDLPTPQPKPEDPAVSGPVVPDITRTLPSPGPRLRLWPGVVIIAVQWLVVTVMGLVAPGTQAQFMAMFGGQALGALLIALWWMFFSRVPWFDRFFLLLACVAGAGMMLMLAHSSVGLFGLIVYGLPTVMTGWIVWLLISFFLGWPIRKAGLLVVFLLGWGYFTLLRMDGVDGKLSATLNWRWSPTAEERFLAENPIEKAPVQKFTGTLNLQPGDWPEFRGPNRDGRLPGVRLATDWDQHPPKKIWGHLVGPGWSSFAVVGTHLYTQEQRGEQEVVVCYDAGTGKEIWTHQDSARFEELIGGPGPRATPTFHEGKIYAQGAAGRLNCLDAGTGEVVWTRDIVADAGAKVPQWGYAASPLVLHDLVTVFAGGPDGKCVLAYRAAKGEPAWSAGEGGQMSYCSPQRAVLDGVEQILISTSGGLTSFHPTTGQVLWKYSWLLPNGARIVQPTLLEGSDVLLGTGFGNGTRRLHIAKKDQDWQVTEVWTSRKISPYFNDFVVHQGYLYGFDGPFFCCINLADGKRKWSERGYDNGQVLLLPDQDLLLIVSESGEVALAETNPQGHRELARFQAIKGKTWNHPVIAHGKLFVRNGEEAACYQLSLVRSQ